MEINKVNNNIPLYCFENDQDIEKLNLNKHFEYNLIVLIYFLDEMREKK